MAAANEPEGTRLRERLSSGTDPSVRGKFADISLYDVLELLCESTKSALVHAPRCVPALGPPATGLALGCSHTTVADDGTAAPAPEPRPALGAPLSAPKGQWTWIDIPGAICNDGTPTGIGAKLTASPNLLVF